MRNCTNHKARRPRLISTSLIPVSLLFTFALIVVLSGITYAITPLLTAKMHKHWLLSNKSCSSLPEKMGSWCQITLKRKGSTLLNKVNLEVIHLIKNNYRAKLNIQPKGKHLKPSAIVKQSNAIIGINAGYFSPEFNPVGFFKLNNKRISRFSSASRLLRAGVSINPKGKLTLTTNPKKTELEKTYSGMQIGPVLIKDGKIAVYKQNYFARRTLLAQTTKGNIIIIVTQSPTSLYMLSSVLVNHPDFFGVKKILRAVNLDGGSSSALSIKLKDKTRNIVELNPVRTLLLFYSKA